MLGTNRDMESDGLQTGEQAKGLLSYSAYSGPSNSLTRTPMATNRISGLLPPLTTTPIRHFHPPKHTHIAKYLPLSIPYLVGNALHLIIEIKKMLYADHTDFLYNKYCKTEFKSNKHFRKLVYFSMLLSEKYIFKINIII